MRYYHLNESGRFHDRRRVEGERRNLIRYGDSRDIRMDKREPVVEIIDPIVVECLRRLTPEQ